MRARIPELDHDAGIVRLLEASVTENVVGGFNALLHDVDGAPVDAPDSALVYARTLARNGVPLSALTRAYRVGHSRFMDLLFDAGVSLPAEARAETLARLVRRSAHWLDEVTAQVAQAYEAEREAWLSGNDGVRRRVVSDLLEHRGIDAGQACRVLGYRFDGMHRCALVQVDRAGRAGEVVDQLRHEFRARAHLAVELGDGVTAAWLTVAQGRRRLSPASTHRVSGWHWGVPSTVSTVSDVPTARPSGCDSCSALRPATHSRVSTAAPGGHGSRRSRLWH